MKCTMGAHDLCARFVMELRLVHCKLSLLFEDGQLSLLLLSLVRLSVLQDLGISPASPLPSEGK